MHVFLYEHMFLFLLNIYLGVEFLGCVHTICLTFWETDKLLSKVILLLYVTLSSV